MLSQLVTCCPYKQRVLIFSEIPQLSEVFQMMCLYSLNRDLTNPLRSDLNHLVAPLSCTHARSLWSWAGLRLAFLWAPQSKWLVTWMMWIMLAFASVEPKCVSFYARRWDEQEGSEGKDTALPMSGGQRQTWHLFSLEAQDFYNVC